MTRRAVARRGLLTIGLVLALVLALSLTWRAVTLIGQGAEPRVLSQAEVEAALATAAASTPGPTSPPGPTPTPEATPSAPPTTGPTPGTTSAPAVVVRDWAVTGGQVGVSCEGDTITLLYATPADGWSVEVKATGPQEVEVELERDDDDSTVRAVCVGGTPEQRDDDD